MLFGPAEIAKAPSVGYPSFSFHPGAHMDSITQLAEQLGAQLKALGAQVCTAESCTGGGIAEAITRIAGSSAWFEAGYVTYSNAAYL